MARKRKTEEPWSREELLALPRIRNEAKKIGSKHYFTGKPCKNFSHIAPRYTSIGKCTMCAQVEATAAYRRDPDKGKAKNKKSYYKHRAKRLEGLVRYKQENPDMVKKHNNARDKEELRRAAELYRAMNPGIVKESNRRYRVTHRTKRNSWIKEWRKKNQLHVKTYAKRYREENYDRLRNYDQAHYNKARKAMPTWADQGQIIELYKERAALNRRAGFVKFHVDHVVPLKGIFKGTHVVCGLHVIENLEIVLAQKNLKKANVYDPLDS